MDSDISQVKRQLEELFRALSQRRFDATTREQNALKEAKIAKEEGEVLAKFIEAAQPVKDFYGRIGGLLRANEDVDRRAEKGLNRKIVVDILTKVGRPMRAIDIAQIAFDEKLIKSKRERDGVYATVSTVLSRGGKNVFINNGGIWDLRSRRLKLDEAPASRRVEIEIPASMKPVEVHDLRFPSTIARIPKTGSGGQ